MKFNSDYFPLELKAGGIATSEPPSLLGIEDKIKNLEAQLEAVRALPDKWRKDVRMADIVCAEFVCAKELETALEAEE